MNEMHEIVNNEMDIRELTVDELNDVSGGNWVRDIFDRARMVYQFMTGTITSHATTLP